MPSAISLSWPEPDIGVLSFDLPGKSANVMSGALLTELEERLREVEARHQFGPAVAGLILTSNKPSGFIVGADLREFGPKMALAKADRARLFSRGQNLFQRFQQTPFPTVAVLDGLCLGGGAELALWCDARIATNQPKTEIGLPEVKLGLIPGWGGTVRLPRLIGVSHAVEMICGGESISSATALALGLVEEVVSREQAHAAAFALVRSANADANWLSTQRSAQPQPMSADELAFLRDNWETKLAAEFGEQCPAQMSALKLLIETANVDVPNALARETEAMLDLFGSPINRALLNVFFLQDRNKRDTGLEAAGPTSSSLKRIGVVGAGIMGCGIVAAALKRGLQVTLSDAEVERLEPAAREVITEVAYDKTRQGPDAEHAARLGARLHTSADITPFRDCDLVIEAIVEAQEPKRELLARLESVMRPDAILASNTSTIPVTKLAEGLSRPEQFCGMHFFNPVRRMKLLEIIRGQATADATILQAVAFGKQIGKFPIVVNDGPGFLVNRLLSPYLNEALEMYCAGYALAHIDAVAMKFGMPIGPFALYDMVGLDTAMLAGRTMWQTFPDRIVASPFIPALVKNKRLGQKSGSGFFKYAPGNPKPLPDADTETLLGQYRQSSLPAERFDDEWLAFRLVLPMLFEATRALDERIVRDVRDVDLGMIFGLGWPSFRGGLLFWADEVGLTEIRRRAEPWQATNPRLRTTRLVDEMERAGRKFYA